MFLDLTTITFVSVPLRGLDMRKQNELNGLLIQERSVSVPLRGLDMRKQTPR